MHRVVDDTAGDNPALKDVAWQALVGSVAKGLGAAMHLKVDKQGYLKLFLSMAEGYKNPPEALRHHTPATGPWGEE